MKSFAKLAAIVGVSLFMGAAVAQDSGTGTTGTSTFGTGATGGDTTGGTGTTDTMQDPQDTQTNRNPTAVEQRHPRAQMDEDSTATTGSSQAAIGGQSQVRDVQSALSSRGYDVQVDGIMGSNTQDALRRFQRDEGLEETGQLDQATLQALNIEATDRAPASVPSDDTGMGTGTGIDSGTGTDTGVGTETDSGTGTGM